MKVVQKKGHHNEKKQKVPPRRQKVLVPKNNITDHLHPERSAVFLELA